MSTPSDKLLALRPTNVVTRLGAQSTLPLLNPRDLLAPFEGERQALLCVPAYGRTTAMGALKAARDLDAVIGIGCPHPLAGFESPGGFVQALCDAAEEVRHRTPFFLQAGPFRASTSDAGAELAGAVSAYVDAGFTSIALDASTLPNADALQAYRALARPAAERGLSIELTAPVDELGRVSVDRVHELLEAVVRDGVRVQFLRLPASAYTLERPARETWQLDLGVLKEVAQAARAFHAALTVEDEGSRPESLATAFLDAQVRKVEPVFAAQRAAQGTASDELRAEANTWALATDVLPKLGAVGSASKAVTHLARGGRY